MTDLILTRAAIALALLLAAATLATQAPTRGPAAPYDAMRECAERWNGGYDAAVAECIATMH